MDKIDTNTIIDELTEDDNDVLRYVLKNVRGSYPDSPYRQTDFIEEFDPEV